MGAAGDMLTAALLEIAPGDAADKIRNLAIPGVRTEIRKDTKQGVCGTHVDVFVNGHEEEPGLGTYDEENMKHGRTHADKAAGHEQEDHDHGHDHNGSHDHTHHGEHEHHHDHHGLKEIDGIIESLDLSEEVKTRAESVYRRIAEAESKVHDSPADEVHFHEVGSLDAVADIVSVCLLMNIIGPDRVVVSPVNAGSGNVRCAHGILPVPAPATTEILKGIPFYKDPVIKSELTTPTGAALLAEFADEYGEMPVMTIERTGIGTGTKDFPKANILRVFLGETEGNGEEETEELTDRVCELSANIDDMTGEELGFAMDQLLKNGALDVYQTPILMKKGRPAVKFSCICGTDDAGRFAELMLRLTSTAGVRASECGRYVLKREISDGKDGIRTKTYSGYGVSRTKFEYDDLAEAAEKEGISLSEAREKHEKSELKK